MCDVELVADGLAIRPSRWERAGGLTGDFVVPWADFVTVSTCDDPIGLVHGVKAGVGLPKTKIGTWHHDGVEDYFCIRGNGPAVVLDLAPGATFARVAVTVDNPAELAAGIRAAIAGHGTGGATS